MLKGISQIFKRVTGRYPFTTALIALTSLALSVFIDQSGNFGSFMEDNGIPFLMLWGIGSFFAETFWAEKKAVKWCSMIAAGIISAGLVRFSGDPSEWVSEPASRWKAVWIIVLITLGVFRNYQYSGQPFNRYCIRVVYKLSRLAIVSFITSLGIGLVMGAFVTLILNGQHYTMIFRAEFLVLGCLLGSGLLDAQISPETKLPRFFIVIIKYLLMVLLLAAFAVIYGYILKIIITRVVPSNEIFRILAALFIIGMPIWTLAGTFAEDHWLVQAAGKLPYIFIPFLFLQGYAIRERITAFGMTPFRYLCLALMVYEVIYILVYAFRSRETGIMLPAAAVMAVICLVMPYFNMYSTSNRSQKAIFDRFITRDFEDLSDDEQSDLAGAYYYLAGNAEGEAMLADTAPEKIEAIKDSGKIGQRDYDRNMYIFYDFPVISTDISGFGSMTLISTGKYYQDEAGPETWDPRSISFYDREDHMVMTTDLSGFINACISAYAEDRTGAPDLSGRIEMEDGSAIQVLHCGMTVDTDRNISYLDINAILLENGSRE